MIIMYEQYLRILDDEALDREMDKVYGPGNADRR